MDEQLKPEQPKKTAPKKRKRPSRAKSAAPRRESIASLEQLSPQALKELQAQLAAKNREMFPELAGVAVYSDQNIAERQAKFEAQTAGAHVISDEWYGQLETGSPFEDRARPYQHDNPDKEFRYISMRESVQQKRGMRGYVPIRDRETGKDVDVAGQKLCWIPKDVYEDRQRKKMEMVLDQIQGGEDKFREVEESAKSELGSEFSAVKSDDGAYYGSVRQ